MITTLLAIASLTFTGCKPGPDLTGSTKVGEVKIELPDTEPVVAPSADAAEEAKSVLLVINKASTESVEIGAYYRIKRQIPKENVLMISVSRTENVSRSEYTSGIEAPIKEAIKNSKNKINYIVLTKGTPIRLENNAGFSVDGHLASMNLPIQPIGELNKENITRSQNPYYGSTERFSSEKWNMYLVTRLTGYTVEDAKKLVDNSLAAKRVDGPFFLDKAGNRTSGGYGQMEQMMERSYENLKTKGFDVQIDRDKDYILPGRPLMGYCTWGSNDGAFNLDTYRKVKFLPGAICETFVSTSGRTFEPTTGGQSLIADLIKNQVTGVKGYVSEPYTFALAQPDILFDRYVEGFNLAEAFYAASLVIKWKDIVIGDPLCRPYVKN
ncbi:MAG: TIGR03790 family protein [Armatimonadetes bacterium]|nr:TIGR03790 family protein [Armatimonadota bacterium]